MSNVARHPYAYMTVTSSRVRADGSTAHLCVFNPNTSALLYPCTGTPQGLAANSTWARGQSWGYHTCIEVRSYLIAFCTGIYGFTMAYRYTGQARFLAYAENVTAYWLVISCTWAAVSFMPCRLANVPSDQVPKWDFDAQPPNDERDTSAAAIVASAYVAVFVQIMP